MPGLPARLTVLRIHTERTLGTFDSQMDAITWGYGEPEMRIHVTPGVDARAAAKDLIATGMVAVDDIGGSLYDLVFEEILEEIGHAADDLDIREATFWGCRSSIEVWRTRAHQSCPWPCGPGSATMARMSSAIPSRGRLRL